MSNKKRKKNNTLKVLYKQSFNGNNFEPRMKDLLQNRKYITVDELSSRGDHISFTVCSYNILAQYQMKNNIYLYTHCDQSVLEWTVRWNNIKNDLERMNCDIYCLQEVQCDHYYIDIEPAMIQMGYRGFLSAKTGKKLDGCAIFIKTSTFDYELSTFETVNFHHRGITALSSDNVGQVALLCPVNRPSSKLCIANTHLFFNPNRGEIKLAELMLMLSRIDSIATSNRCDDRLSDNFYWPIVFCGDFNSEPSSLIYSFITEGKLDMTGVLASDVSGQNKSSYYGNKSTALLSSSQLPLSIGISDQMVVFDQSGPRLTSGPLVTHSLQLRSSYSYTESANERPVTALTNSATCAVDFIFYRHINGEKITRPYLRLLSCLELLTTDQLFSVGGIPNMDHGSDHIPIVAKYRMHL